MTELTPPRLKTLIKKPGRHADGAGLYFRTTGEGKAYFVYRYRLDGKAHEMSLGPFPDLGLGDARRRHSELRTMVLNGHNPMAAKKKTGKVVHSTGKPTFGEVADDYVETNEGSWRNPKHRQQWRMTLTEHAKAIRSKPVDEVTTADVVSVLKPIWTKTPETASRLRGRIEVVLDAARALGHIPEDKANPARWRGHLDKLLSKRAKLLRGHHSAMPYADMPKLILQLKATPSAAAKALQFVILTATRTNETLGAKWPEFDLKAKVWSIPKERMKMQRPHEVPLSPQAVEIVMEQSAARRENPYVFAGQRPMRPLSSMSMAMLLRRMGVEFTVHGFRSAFRNWAAEQAVPFEVAESCLAHSVGNAVTQAYLRTTMTERRRPIMIEWARHVLGEPAAVDELRMVEA